MDFSVLISVYWKEKPEHLKVALESIWLHQTLRPSEIVLVKDGKLTRELDEVVLEFGKIAPLKICALDHNQGLGIALARGLEICSNELVARMDSDDISSDNRFNLQINMLKENPEIDILGTDIAEFVGDVNNIYSHRRLPTKIEEIKKIAKIKNPMNHVTVVFKKSAVLKAGNYRPFNGYEDYYLWIRMMKNGAILKNISMDLVFVRVENMFARRHGIFVFKQELKFQKEMLKLGFLNIWEFFRNIILRCLPRLFPLSGLKLVYKFSRR